ncbi:MAG: hypothetical protein H7A24_02785 [Leptospiraceae bacterium]|nr:hypothetical protein [Leptospiraceae bacterium]MCP5510774.1 hypothetical protein [Leptospiraceae bacterium]
MKKNVLFFIFFLFVNCIYRLNGKQVNEKVLNEVILTKNEIKYCKYSINDQLKFHENELSYFPEITCIKISKLSIKKELKKQIIYTPELERSYFRDVDNPIFLLSFFYWSIPNLCYDGVIYLYKSNFDNMRNEVLDENKENKLPEEIKLNNKDIEIEIFDVNNKLKNIIYLENNKFNIPYIFLELDKRKRSEMKIKINFLLKSPLGEVEKINHILDIQKYENEEENRFIIWRLRKML